MKLHSVSLSTFKVTSIQLRITPIQTKYRIMLLLGQEIDILSKNWYLVTEKVKVLSSNFRYG